MVQESLGTDAVGKAPMAESLERIIVVSLSNGHRHTPCIRLVHRDKPGYVQMLDIQRVHMDNQA